MYVIFETSNLGVKTVIHGTANFAIKDIKGRTIISDQQNLENNAF